MFYKKQKTRIRGHLDRPSRIAAWLRESKRIAAGPGDEMLGLFHGGDWLTDAEFEAALRNTLDFLQRERRPYWESVVAEHEAFLQSQRE